MSSEQQSTSSHPVATVPSFNGYGKGKGGKVFRGKIHAKRFGSNKFSDPLLGVTKPAIRRVCRRGGVKRISGNIYEEVRGILKKWLENTMQDSLAYCEHARRKTITSCDVVYALRRQGQKLYGFDK